MLARRAAAGAAARVYDARVDAGADDRHENDHGAERDDDWTALLGRDPAVAAAAWARTVDAADFADDDAVLRRLEAIMASERAPIAQNIADYPQRVRATRPSFVIDEYGQFRTRAAGTFMVCLAITWIPAVGDEIGELRQWTLWVCVALAWTLGVSLWTAWR